MNSGIQVLIEATPNYLNVGDVAMLEVSIARLRCLWPDPRITVFTADCELLQRRFPGLSSVPTGMRTLWFRTAASETGTGDPALASFVDRLSRMDLFVISGMGSYHDAGGEDAVHMLDTILLMTSLGVPAVAFGQGIGPLHRESPVWAAAQRSLPSLQFIALREARSGPALLHELGVSSDRVVITGDDAIERAYSERVRPLSTLLGINLRASSYGGITTDRAQSLAPIFHTVARHLNASITTVPTCYVPGTSDLETFIQMFPDQNIPLAPGDTQAIPQWSIDQIGRCRMVIAGGYHAAVFSLSQGIPAVCIENSQYYREKFLGLADQFGAGCSVIPLNEPDFEIRVLRAATELWQTADSHHTPLLHAAAKQIDSSKAAWAQLPHRIPALAR